MKKLFILFILLSLSGGCQLGIDKVLTGAMQGAVQGYVYWKGGEAIKYYEYDVQTIKQATEQAFKQMKLPVKTNEVKGKGYKLIAGDKDRFKVSIEQVQDHITKVTVRVNIMGDKPYVELLYKHLDDQINVIDFPSQYKF
jgi:transcription antitermination factor NusG